VAIDGYIHRCDQVYRLNHSVSLSCSFENELNCGCTGGCCWNVASYLLIKAANSWYIDVWDHLPIILPKMEDQKSLSLRRPLFSEWGRECVSSSFAYKGSLYLIYDPLHPIATQNTQHARPEIIDLRWTLIFRMRHGAFLTCCRL
jgi:hypothetical protein